jgi:hypothetical protein
MLYLLWKGSLIFVTITTVVILEIIISLWHCIKNQIEDKHKWVVKFATKRTANHFQIHSMHGLDDCKFVAKLLNRKCSLILDISSSWKKYTCFIYKLNINLQLFIIVIIIIPIIINQCAVQVEDYYGIFIKF